MFNAHKNELHERQIGDRRLPHAKERSVDGPSRRLPRGVLTLSSCMAASQTVVIFITGRRSPMNGHAPTCCLFTTNLKSCKALRLPAKPLSCTLVRRAARHPGLMWVMDLDYRLLDLWPPTALKLVAMPVLDHFPR